MEKNYMEIKLTNEPNAKIFSTDPLLNFVVLLLLQKFILLLYRYALMDIIISMVTYSSESCIEKVYKATIPLLQVCLLFNYKLCFLLFV